MDSSEETKFSIKILPEPAISPEAVHFMITHNGSAYSSLLLKNNQEKIKVLVSLLNNILTGETDET